MTKTDSNKGEGNNTLEQAAVDTLFVRHKMARSPSILTTLWQEDLIAVHYLDSESVDPEYYRQQGEKRAATVLERLHKCLATGAIVAATYRDIMPAMLKVGKIVPGTSRIIPSRFCDDSGNELIYKVVNLVNVTNIELRQYPVFAAIQPRGGAVTGWPSAAKLLLAIADQVPLPISLDALHPSQLEVLCYEYLRERQLISSLLGPIGRNMYEVDICGIDANGFTVLAQVTYANELPKFERLRSFASQDSRLFYFGPASMAPSKDSITFIPIEHVFASMYECHRNLVVRMINPV